jgi:thiamine pyrophosphokinase
MHSNKSKYPSTGCAGGIVFFMRAVVFANGIFTESQLVLDHIHPDDFLIAADGGAQHCLALGLTPAVIVGDLDSLSEEYIKSLQADGVKFIVHPSTKDQTDLELALDYAVNLGVKHILLIGFMGGRLDQTIANLLLLTRAEWKHVSFTLINQEETGRLIRSGETLTIRGEPGDVVSLIPFSPTVDGITTSGLRWSLDKAKLDLGSTLGISNELSNHTADVQVASGDMLIVHKRQITPV